jgi:two-component system chemotaxis response regulator CheB
VRLRKAGATTFAQDEETSVVYGMPREAWEQGGAAVQLPLEDIATHIVRQCSHPLSKS